MVGDRTGGPGGGAADARAKGEEGAEPVGEALALAEADARCGGGAAPLSGGGSQWTNVGQNSKARALDSMLRRDTLPETLPVPPLFPTLAEFSESGESLFFRH